MKNKELHLLRVLLAVAEGKVPGLFPEARMRVIQVLAKTLLERTGK